MDISSLVLGAWEGGVCDLEFEKLGFETWELVACDVLSLESDNL